MSCLPKHSRGSAGASARQTASAKLLPWRSCQRGRMTHQTASLSPWGLRRLRTTCSSTQTMSQQVATA